MLRFNSSFRLDQTSLAFVISKLRKRSLPFIILTLAACVVCSVVVASYWATSSHAEVAAPTSVRQIGPNFKPAYKVTQRKQNVAASAKNVTKALSVASGDLDNDGVPDLITGFGATRGTGSITVQRGNPDAYAPKDEALLQRVQQGYDPPSFLAGTKTYNFPERIDFLSIADLNDDGNPDVLAAAAGGGLYVLMGSRTGELSDPEPVNLSGGVTALATGEFGKPDGRADIAVGVDRSGGSQVLIFDGASGALNSTPSVVPVLDDARDLAFSGFDGDKFSDLALISGPNLEIIHGQSSFSTGLVAEQISLPFAVESMAVGDFLNDRNAVSEISVLTSDGLIELLRRNDLDTRPYTPEEQTARLRNRLNTQREPETPTSSGPVNWMVAGQLDSRVSPSAKLHAAHVSAASTEDLFVLGDSAKGTRMMISDFTGRGTSQLPDGSLAISRTGFTMQAGSPIAMASFRQKANGNRDIAMVDPNQDSASIVPLVATNITVDRLDDPVAPAAACTGAANDCSLRGAIQFSNVAGNVPATINLPAGTYSLTIDGTAEAGLCGSPNTGDLDLSGDGTTILGAGSSTTFIKGTTPNDRVMCVDAPLLGSFDFLMSGVTVAGGRDTSGVGAGGVVTGGVNDVSTFNAVVMTNNRTSGAGSPVGAGIGNGAGSLTVTNSVLGGTVTVAACANQAATNCGNQSQGSGAGIYQSVNADVNKTFILSNSVVQNNNSTGGNGAGVITSSGGGSYATKSITNTSFLSNTAPGAGALGGGTYNESGGTMTINGTTYVSNSAAAGFGGAVAAAAGANHNTNINFARFVSNTAGAGTVLRGGNGSVMTATNCWWALNTGPAASQISEINPADVVTPSFLVLRAAASPSSILLNSATTITADFLTDSNTAAVAPSNLFSMAGVGVTWSNPQKGALSNQINAIRTVVNISSATEAGSTVTITANNHGFGVGQVVTIRGVPVVGYDGIFTITATTTNTFNYTNTVSGLAAAGAAGTATVPFGNATATFTSGGVSASCGTGSADVAVDGVTVTPQIIIQCPDLTTVKTNNVSNAAVVGQTWTWTQTISNASGAFSTAANFSNGQVILTDNLPNSVDINYSVTTPSITLSGVNSGTVACSINGTKDLSCTANGAVVIGVGGNFQVQWTATANSVATYANPRGGGGISAVDPGNVIVESNEGNNTSSNSVVVSKAATTTTITNAVSLNTTPTVVGESYAVNWAVTVNPPGALGVALTGNVTVSDGTANCVAAVSAGTCNLTSTTAGAKSITAAYAGDANYLASTSSPASPHTVNKANTTTTITNAATLTSTPSVTGQAVTVQWSVTVNAPGSVGAALTGNVTVSDGTNSCFAAIATGQCNITFTSAGAKSLTATYAGDTNYNTSASSPATAHTVNPADTTTTVTNAASLNSTPTVVGQSYAVNWSVTVNAPGSLGVALTGNVTVSDGTANCIAAVGAGTCNITSTTAGAKNITATYAGDANYNTSTSANAPHTVNKANTATSITNAATLNSTPTVVGQPYAVNWSVTVSAPGSLGAALTGNVTVSDGTANCVAAVSAGTCNLTSTTAGAKNITATYAGDTNYNTSTSANAPHTVNGAGTTTTITSDAPDPSAPGQSVTVNYTVVANPPSGGTPTGNVNVTVSGGVETCTGTVAAGTCSLVLNTLGVGRVITATYVGNADFNTSNDTETHDVVAVTNPNISVQDARVAEPTSGTTSMLFTVALSAPAPAGGTSVDYATAVGGVNPATPGSDYTAITTTTLNFAAGQQIKTVAVTVSSDADNLETDETLLLNLSNPVNGTIVDGQATGTITVANAAGAFLISELRTSGPAGPDDDFIEVYNNTNSPLTVAASDATAGYGVYKKGVDCNATPVLVGTIPNGTVIPARGHYLLVGSSYSLGAYATGNLTLTQNLDSDTNVAVFSTAEVTSISSVNRLDAVGFGANTGGGVCDLLREGTNLPPVSGSTSEHSFQRDQCGKGGAIGNFGVCPSSTPVDSNNNNADFQFGDTQGTFIAGVTQKLGAPGPENLASPLLRNTGFLVNVLDPGAPATLPPNRVRDLTSNPGNNSTFGTMSIRRAVTNNTGAPVTKLRIRIIDMTVFPAPAGIADIRPLTSGQIIVALTGGGNATVEGTTVDTPPAQPNGGGINSTMSASTITLGTPLANGATINLQFLLGVQQTGAFRYYINIEALP